jgi:hypothetical protein
MATVEENRGINFVHASPGFVDTNWGTELHPVLRRLVRIMQRLLGKKPLDGAENMLGPTVFASEQGNELPQTLPLERNTAMTGRMDSNSSCGVIVMGQNGESKSLTKGHTKEAKKFVWDETMKVLNRAGFISQQAMTWNVESGKPEDISDS